MPKINELPAASALTATDLLAMDNSSGTATKCVSGAQIKTFVTADVNAEVTDLKNAFGDVSYTVQNGKYANSAGAIASDSIFDLYSIDVPAGAKVTGTCGMTSNGINYIYFYDGSGNPVGEGYRNTASGVYRYDFDLTVPAGASNVKISHRNNVSVTFSVNIEDQTKGIQSLAAGVASKMVYPDGFSGTDTQKIQAAIDAVATTGGIIIIDRIYTLTGNVFCYTPTDDSSVAENNHRYTTFLGVGRRAGFECGSSYYFSGANGLEGASFGGFRFKNINFHSSNHYAFVAMQKWIRMVFDNCRFNGFKTVFYSGSLMQNVTCVNCYFTNLSGYVVDLTAGAQIYACQFMNCICENSKGLIGADLGVTSYWSSVTVENCTIEALSGCGIVFGKGARGVNIKNNYFELNSNGDIDLGNLFADSHTGNGINIEGNSFMLNGSGTGLAILLPRREPLFESDSEMHGVISGNYCSGELFTVASQGDPITKYHWILLGNSTSANEGKFYVPSVS